MSNSAFIPPNVLPPLLQKFAPLLKRKWFRELVLLWPTLTRRRFSNKTEDYGVFKPSLVGHFGQLAVYVQDIARSRIWYQKVAGLTHSRTSDPEPHPSKPGWTLRACYMSAKEHDECLVLLEERDPSGKMSVPSGMSFFHFALEVEGNRKEDVFAFAAQQKRDGFHLNYGPVQHNSEPPDGDGETGGNVACYLYDPDWHNVEFCGAMDTIENYRARYGDKKGSDRN
ncbi:MAG: VOC family protein [Phyllobacteriaceae bacterium]|nr:VOC family protein [Phyllobacteriaceae bacterium]